jgi:hypothetical protein
MRAMALSAVSSPRPCGLSVFNENPVALSPSGQYSTLPQSPQKVAVVGVSVQQRKAVRATNFVSLPIFKIQLNKNIDDTMVNFITRRNRHVLSL